MSRVFSITPKLDPFTWLYKTFTQKMSRYQIVVEGVCIVGDFAHTSDKNWKSSNFGELIPADSYIVDNSKKHMEQYMDFINSYDCRILETRKLNEAEFDEIVNSINAFHKTRKDYLDAKRTMGYAIDTVSEAEKELLNHGDFDSVPEKLAMFRSQLPDTKEGMLEHIKQIETVKKFVTGSLEGLLKNIRSMETADDIHSQAVRELETCKLNYETCGKEIILKVYDINHSAEIML